MKAIDLQTLSARAEELIFQDAKGTIFQILPRVDLHEVVSAHQNNKVLDDVSEPNDDEEEEEYDDESDEAYGTEGANQATPQKSTEL